MAEQFLDNETRYQLLRRLADEPGLSQRQLAREFGISQVSCYGYFVAFSEAARVCGKARRAGKGHSLVKRRNAVHGRAQLRPTCHVIQRERLCAPITALRSFAMARHDAVARLVLGTHRRSEYGKIPVTGH